MSLTYHDSNHRMSQIVVHNDTAYLAGQVAEDASASMANQTRQTLDNIERLLSAAGTSKQHLLSAQIWVSNMDEFAEMNEVWDAWIVPARPPVRACVEAKLAKPEWKVEIMVVAALPESAT